MVTLLNFGREYGNNDDGRYVFDNFESANHTVVTDQPSGFSL